ncbi:MAG: hypothetical protein HYX39_07365 [Bacteroidetes bacterium]|nr:hypothetical protein [Bacteroidota bacterium]
MSLKVCAQTGSDTNVGSESKARNTDSSSIGLNLKRFYILGSYSNDYNLFNNKALDFSSASISGNFTFGWRFYTNTPKFYKKFQQTKIYKLF